MASKSSLKRALNLLDKHGARSPGKRTKDFVPTGLIGFDESIGGGLVKGRIYEVAGMEQAGKTTFVCECIKAIQALGQTVLYNDYEHVFDINYAEDMGVDISEEMFIFEQPKTLEAGMAVSRALIETGDIGMDATDSVAAMVAKMEIEADEKGKNQPAMQARAFGPKLKQYIQLLSSTGTIGIFVNQVRADFSKWGSGLATPGGKALKFFASSRMFMSAGKSKVYDDGIHAKIRIWKNKQSPDQRGLSEYEIRPSKGIVREEELLDIGKKKGLIKERGGIFKIKDKSIRGREKMMEALQDDRIREWIVSNETTEDSEQEEVVS